jgi:hypothetical protein
VVIDAARAWKDGKLVMVEAKVCRCCLLRSLVEPAFPDGRSRPLDICESRDRPTIATPSITLSANYSPGSMKGILNSVAPALSFTSRTAPTSASRPA